MTTNIVWDWTTNCSRLVVLRRHRSCLQKSISNFRSGSIPQNVVDCLRLFIIEIAVWQRTDVLWSAHLSRVVICQAAITAITVTECEVESSTTRCLSRRTSSSESPNWRVDVSSEIDAIHKASTLTANTRALSLMRAVSVTHSTIIHCRNCRGLEGFNPT